MRIKSLVLIALGSILLTHGCKNKQKVVDIAQKTKKENAPITETIPKKKEEKKPVQISMFAQDDYRPTATKFFDLIHTRLDVKFDWANAYLLGKAELTLKPHFYSTDKLILDAKGFDIHSIELINGKTRKSLKFDYDGLRTRIYLGKTFTRTENVKLAIDYTAKPNELGTVVKAGRAITDDKGLFFINNTGELDLPRQIWTQGETESSSCWFPTIDAPNQKTTQEIYITVEKDFISLSNGKLISSIINKDGTRTDYWKQDQPHAPYLFMMAVGNFSKVEDSWRNIPVDYYVEPEYEIHAREIFKNTKKMLDFYSELFGIDYNWDKYAQIPVRQYVSGAMENTGAVIFGDYIQQTTRELMDENYERVIAHEMAHHWFGDLVTCESWAQLPLNESFATYGEYLWNEHAYGKNEAEYNFQQTLNGYLSESKHKKEALIRHHHGIPDDMFDSHSYNKGAWVLHTLRAYIGDDAFFTSLNLFLEQNKFKAAEIDHLRLAFEEVTGEDLNWFFDQWFLSSGHPELVVSHDFDMEKKQLKVTVKQVQDLEKAPVYRLPLNIDVYFAKNETKRFPIIVDRTEQTFKIELEEKPILVNFAAKRSLLATIEHKKTNDEFEVQFYAATHYLDKVDAIYALSSEKTKRAKTIMQKLMGDKFWYYRYLGITDFSPTGFKTDTVLFNTLKEIATNDPKSQVRYAAINKLGEMKFNTTKDFFLQVAQTDSSLLVIDALLSVAKPDQEFSMQLAQHFESDSHVTPFLSDLYAEQGDKSKADFFEKAFKMAKGYKKWQIIENYAKYLLRFDPTFINQHLDFLVKTSQKHDVWWIRGAASENLSGIYQIAKGKSSQVMGEGAEWNKLKIRIKQVLETNIKSTEHKRLQVWYSKIAAEL